MKQTVTIGGRRRRGAGGTWAAIILGASLGSSGTFAVAAAQSTAGVPAKAPTSTYNYGPGPQTPACAQGQVRLALSAPKGSYYGGSPVPFKVQIVNLSSRACSITALQPPSGLSTELVYVQLFDARGRRVLIPGGPPGLRARMLPQSLHAHQVFSYTCTWNGRAWTALRSTHPSGALGSPAPAGRYSAEAVLANPPIQTAPLNFVLKAR
jgi:hypothetical protein